GRPRRAIPVCCASSRRVGWVCAAACMDRVLGESRRPAPRQAPLRPLAWRRLALRAAGTVSLIGPDMTGNEIRKRFLEHFASREHLVLPSAPLVPKGDPSTLFISAGMQPLQPYYQGFSQPPAPRLASSQ